MANAIYDKWVGKLISDRLAAQDIKVVLVNVTGAGTLYAFAQSHEFLSDIPADARIALSGNLASKTFVAGTFDAADLTPAFPSATGDISEAIVIYEDTGTAATSTLIAFIDTATGLAITPDGNNIDITWNAAGIFSL